MAKHLLVVHVNAKEGMEEEFSRWYDEEHIPDLLTLPGIVGAQRFKVSEGQDKPGQFKHLVIYEVEGDIAEAIAANKNAKENDLFPLTPAIDPVATSVFWSAVTEPVYRDKK